jgi:hypothetical protein
MLFVVTGSVFLFSVFCSICTLVDSFWILSSFICMRTPCAFTYLVSIVMIILFDMFGSFALEPGCFWWRCVVASESLCVLVLCLVEGSR